MAEPDPESTECEDSHAELQQRVGKTGQKRVAARALYDTDRSDSNMLAAYTKAEEEF